MAAKESERPSYAELLDLARQGKVSIDRAFYDKLLKDGHRTTAIMSEVLLDDILRVCLTSHFSHNTEEIEKLLCGPLDSLKNKATLAYALGLIDATTMGNLWRIYRIRCEFAHRGEMDFADEEVLALLGQIPRTKGQEKVTAENSLDFFTTTVFKLAIKFKKYLIDVRGSSGVRPFLIP